MHFQVQIRYKNKDNTESIKNYSFNGLFDAQNRAFGLFEKLVSGLKKEALSDQRFLIWILQDGKPVKVFESKQWLESECI